MGFQTELKILHPYPDSAASWRERDTGAVGTREPLGWCSCGWGEEKSGHREIGPLVAHMAPLYNQETKHTPLSMGTNGGCASELFVIQISTPTCPLFSKLPIFPHVSIWYCFLKYEIHVKLQVFQEEATICSWIFLWVANQLPKKHTETY